MTLPAKAAELLRLHLDPELLVLVNAWDVISATIVAGLPGCRAIATASHSIAASHGYPADLGVARISFGPWSQRIALTALADAGTALLAGGAPPPGVRAVS